eukprot:COSAG06_NODE_4147_length_4525_cov_8.137822_2_plen_183_part_00
MWQTAFLLYCYRTAIKLPAADVLRSSVVLGRRRDARSFWIAGDAFIIASFLKYNCKLTPTLRKDTDARPTQLNIRQHPWYIHMIYCRDPNPPGLGPYNIEVCLSESRPSRRGGVRSGSRRQPTTARAGAGVRLFRRADGECARRSRHECSSPASPPAKVQNFRLRVPRYPIDAKKDLAAASS